ncbi:MAG: aminopeptidase P N-terminal domain-containing protein [Phycisphaerales bacterium]|nr:MAG: aminopeptidase P N-terminal domain-containing protein [Phycisphaerales bacterium]
MGEVGFRMACPPEAYRQRRARLAAGLRRPMVLLSGNAPARDYAANPYPFLASSTYLYFGGPPIENAALVIEPGSDGDEGCELFRQAREPDDLVWLGNVPSDERLAGAAGLGAHRVATTDRLASRPAAGAACCICPPFPEALRWALEAGLQQADNDELLLVVDMRLCKDDHELEAMRRAADVGVEAQLAAMRATQPGRREADVAAALTEVLVAHECTPSFTPIITTAGEVLHATGYSSVLKPGQLVLVDAGAETPTGYTSDMTRTWPVSGEWSDVQRHLYDTVWRAQAEAIAACVPGRRFRDIHDLAAKVICEGLIEAELLRGDPAELTQRYAHTLFFCHGLGHLIGLDVHDMEDFGDLAGYAPGRTRRPEFGNKFLRLDRDLEPGMCVTIEPGVYLNPAIWARDDLVGPLADVVNRPKVDALLKERFGGIRIEETVCILQHGGPEILTETLPNDPDAVAVLAGAA